MTISSKGICTFIDGKPQDFTPLNEWLNNRETFDKIKQLNFFKNFVEWKTIKIWRKTYVLNRKKFALEKL